MANAYLKVKERSILFVKKNAVLADPIRWEGQTGARISKTCSRKTDNRKNNNGVNI
ncbi:MAG: hypothetical protein RHS_3494 [Robinsoniella sp. RHS]|nr:MAG: hypothetical protein RHS_3494 [Robinsoniella sp. RHS]